ncbi:Variant surface glycoprotein [Trypanosoma congolense IL3000]|uniref:Variant surface glycoprotein n=1 Tax=Trypanosoma congolense (strain IL3000) TaxID=1068625 RepID=F9WEL3_TRYCI|nr:Variant surface glycoprotein [Trypanosoma congolense IL3000]
MLLNSAFRLLICVSTVSLWLHVCAENLNRREYRAMCRIYRIALRHHNDSASAYVGSQLDWKRFDELYERVKACVEATGNTTEGEVELETDFGSVKLPSGPVTAKAHNICVAGAGKMDHINKAAQLLKVNAEDAAQRAIANLKTAITTEKNLENAGQEPRGWNDDAARDATCDSHENGGRAGVQLTTDLICLCIGMYYNTHKACGTGIPGHGGFRASQKKFSKEKDHWADIHKDCDKMSVKDDFTIENINTSIENFNALLGAKPGKWSTKTKKSSWVLGHTAEAPSCRTNETKRWDKNICIDYGLSDGSLGEIKWRSQIYKTRNFLLEAEANIAKARKLLERMEFLLVVLEKDLLLANISNSLVLAAGLKTVRPHVSLKSFGGTGLQESGGGGSRHYLALMGVLTLMFSDF